MQTAPEQDGSPAVAKPTPLFRIDPGWPFVIAGLLLLVAGVLIPAQRDLQELRNTLEIHRALEDQSIRQLAAYDRFLNDLDHGDEQLVGRLAASQLNLMPKDERSMLLVPTLNATVTQWIEDSEPAILPNPPAYPDTLLSRLATGPRRLWVLACGAFLVFVGLMLSPTVPSSRRGARRVEHAPSSDPTPSLVPAVVAAAPAAVATSTLVVDDTAAADAEIDADASSEEHHALVAEDTAVAVLEEPAGSSRLEGAFTAVESESEVEAEAEMEAAAAVEVEAEEVVAEAVAEVEVAVEAEEVPVVEAGAVEPGLAYETVEDETEVEDQAEVEADSELEDESDDETDASDDDSFACVDGEAVEMPDAVLSADADAVCMSDMTRASESSAVIVELKPPVSDELDAASLPHAESVETIDGGTVVESVLRAETEALPGEIDRDGEEMSVEVEPSIPSANDRALDALSLFHGLSDDRWISTSGRG